MGVETIEIITDILKWLVPAGGIGSVMIWHANRTQRQMKSLKDTHDAYKMMYQDIKMTLSEELNEKRALRRIISRFEKAFSKAVSCRYYNNCPVDHELRRNQEDFNEQPFRQQDPGQPCDPGETGN